MSASKLMLYRIAEPSFESRLPCRPCPHSWGHL